MPRGRTTGAINCRYYTLKITKYDLENNQVIVGKYCSLTHYNNIHGTNMHFAHLQAIRRLGKLFVDYTLEDVKKAKESSALSKYGIFIVEPIKEEVSTETFTSRHVESPTITNLML